MILATATVARISQRLRAYHMFSIACTGAFIVFPPAIPEPGRRDPAAFLLAKLASAAAGVLLAPTAIGRVAGLARHSP
jgi:hypothetical protein